VQYVFLEKLRCKGYVENLTILWAIFLAIERGKTEKKK